MYVCGDCAICGYTIPARMRSVLGAKWEGMKVTVNVGLSNDFSCDFGVTRVFPCAVTNALSKASVLIALMLVSLICSRTRRQRGG